MDQVRSDQIISVAEKEQNRYFAPPRDLIISTQPAPEIVPKSKDAAETAPTTTQPSTGGTNYGDNLNDTVQNPPTPAIKSVKSQIVNIADDGTVTVDLVLDVQDIPGITEYDIRVAKDAGNL